MSSHIDGTLPHTMGDGIAALEGAFRTVLGEEFEPAIRQLVETHDWLDQLADVSELFRLWVCDNIHSPEDPHWIFQPVRVTERKLLCDALGIDRASIVGLSQTVLANRLLAAVGLPSGIVRGRAEIVKEWRQIRAWIEDGEDDKAASVARQCSERFLRLQLHFYCHVGLVDVLAEIVEDPGSLRIPQRLIDASAAGGTAPLLGALREDGWADLGFLSLVLPKFSKRVTISGRGLWGSQAEIFSATDGQTFLELSRALQPYTHDRPSRADQRKKDLEDAVERVIESIERMIAANVVPDQLVVLETCRSVVGLVFRGMDETKAIRHLATDSLPPLGSRIWYLANAKRQFAKCVWSPTLGE